MADSAFESWWDDLSLKGDPLHRPNLVREAFNAGAGVVLERVQELERRIGDKDFELIGMHEALRKEARRAARVLNAADEAIALCDRNRPTMAAAVLRTVAGDVDGPEPEDGKSRVLVLARRILRADDCGESEQAWHWAVELARTVLRRDTGGRCTT